MLVKKSSGMIYDHFFLFIMQIYGTLHCKFTGGKFATHKGESVKVCLHINGHFQFKQTHTIHIWTKFD